MKAIVYHQYGSSDVLELQDIDKPTMKDDEVLVRVRAASANPADWHFMRGVPYVMRPQSGLRKPKKSVLGGDIAGRVEAVGKHVTQFRPGNEVFGNVGAGGFAEYTCVSESLLVLKPANLTFEQAASVPLAALTALQGLRHAGQLQPDQKVLIIGASGGVGTFAVQIAKSFGADVTGVCSTRNVDLVRAIGADQVIDYTKEDFSRTEQRYDVMLDLIGSRSLSDCRRALTRRGTYVLVGVRDLGRWFGLAHQIKALLLSPFARQRMRVFVVRHNREDLAVLKDLVEAEKVAPVIDRRYKLSEVPEALRHQGEGHTQGKSVIAV